MKKGKASKGEAFKKLVKHFKENPEPISIGDLCDEIGTPRSTVEYNLGTSKDKASYNLIDLGLVDKKNGKYHWYTYEPLDDQLTRIISDFREKYLRFPLTEEIEGEVKREGHEEEEESDLPGDEELGERIEFAKQETGWREPSRDEIREANREVKEYLSVASILDFWDIREKEESIKEQVSGIRKDWFDEDIRRVKVIGCKRPIFERAIVKGGIRENQLEGAKKYLDKHSGMVSGLEEETDEDTVIIRFEWKDPVKFQLSRERGQEEESIPRKVANAPPWEGERMFYLFKLGDAVRASEEEIDREEVKDLIQPKDPSKFTARLRKRRAERFDRLISTYDVPVWEIPGVEEFLLNLARKPEEKESEFGEESGKYFKSLRHAVDLLFDFETGKKLREKLYEEILERAMAGKKEYFNSLNILGRYFDRWSEKREKIFTECLEKIVKLSPNEDIFPDYVSILSRSQRRGHKSEKELKETIEEKMEKGEIGAEKGEKLFDQLF